MSDLSSIFSDFQKHTFTSDKCFLCGIILTNENITEEHVIPKWLQHRFNLWDQNLLLLNGTPIQYRRLVIPCCFDCNNLYLNPFENKVKAAFDSGIEEFRMLSKEVLFLWLGKVYFGLMYRELFLINNRADPNSGTITNPEYLRSFYSHFLFLQGIRGLHRFIDFFPASFYFFKTQRPKNIEAQWDLFDSHNSPLIAIRMGEIGVISVLQDCETTYGWEDEIDRLKDLILHPLQFRELIARTLYKSMLMNRTPKYINLLNDTVAETHLMPLQGLSTKPVYGQWDNNTYTSILSQVSGAPIEMCRPEYNKVYTWMIKPDGSPNFMPV